MRISDWSSDVCSSDLGLRRPSGLGGLQRVGSAESGSLRRCKPHAADVARWTPTVSPDGCALNAPWLAPSAAMQPTGSTRDGLTNARRASLRGKQLDTLQTPSTGKSAWKGHAQIGRAHV